MDNIKKILNGANGYEQLKKILDGFTPDNIQIKWYGSRRFKHNENYDGTVSLNDLFAAAVNQANNNLKSSELKKIIKTIKKLDREAQNKLKKSSWITQKLHFIPHLFGKILFDRDNAEEFLYKQAFGSSQSKQAQEWIKSNSSVDSQTTPDEIPIQKDEYLFLQIHAGKFVNATHLDLEPVLTFALEVLISKNQEHPTPSLQALIEKLSKAEKLVLALEEGVFEEKLKVAIDDAFATQKPLLIPGGWNEDRSFLAMYYEVIPTSETHATFRIYDLSKDSKDKVRQADHLKVRDTPYRDFHGVNATKLKDRLFQRILNEMLSKRNKELAFTSDDVYIALINLLQPQNLSQENESSEKFMSAPENNVSPFRSLMAILANELPINTYKQLKVEFKVKSIISYYNWLMSQNKYELDSYVLLEKGYKRTSRSIELLLKKGILDQEQSIDYVAKLNPVTQWLQNHKSIKQVKFEAITHKKEYPDTFEPLSSPASIAKDLKNLQAEIKEVPSTSFVTEEIRLLREGFNEKNALEALKKLVDIGQRSWDQRSYLALKVGLEKWIYDLPSDVEFWQTAFGTKSGAKEGIIHLGRLAEIYFKCCLMSPGSQTVSSEKELTLFILGTLQQHGVKIISPGNEYYKSYHGDKIKSYQDAMVNKKFDEYRRFLTFSHEKRLLKDIFFDSCHFDDDQETKRVFQNLYSQSFDSECHSAFENWSRGKVLNNETYINFFGSDALPGWLKAVRNTFLTQMALQEAQLNVIANTKNELDLRCRVSTTYRHFSLDLAIIGEKSPLMISKTGYQPEPGEGASPIHRYLMLFRPFNSSKIVSFFRKQMHQKGASEKVWLSKHPKSDHIDLSPEEYRELMQLYAANWLGTEETFVQAVSVIDFFTRHPEKFEDLDYQTIFQQQFFLDGLQLSLSLSWTWETSVLQQAAHLLFKSFQHLSSAKRIQPSVFLLQMLRYLSKLQNAKIPLDCGDELRRLLKIPGLTVDEKSVIYAEFVAYINDKTELSDQDKVEFLTALAFIERYPVPNEWKDPKIEDVLRKAPHRLASAMNEHIKNLQYQQVEAIVKTIYPNETAKEWKLSYEGDTAVLTSGRSKYYPLHGVLFLDGMQGRMRPLPRMIQESAGFASAFPFQEEAEQISPFIYTFRDSFANQVLVKYNPNDNRVTVEKDFQGTFATLINENKLLVEKDLRVVSLLSSKSLPINYSAWEIPDQKLIYLVDPKSSETKYKCTHEGKKVKIVRLTDGAEMGLPSKLLERIEHPDYIQEWYLEGALKEIELPRFGLTFIRNPENPSLFICKELDGWHFNPAIALPKLGRFDRYLILENDNEEKKALFPNVDIHSEYNNSMVPNYNVFAGDNHKNLDYILFEIDDQGLLKRGSAQENLYAAQIYALGEEYITSAKYLRHYGPKLLPYSEGELKGLQAIANLLDPDPNAKSIRLYASYLILKNNQGKEADLKIAAKNFRLYLSSLKNISALKLSREEEIFLLKTLLNYSYDPVFYLRLEALDKNALDLLHPYNPTSSAQQKFFDFILPDGAVLQRLHRSQFSSISLDKVLITRLEPELKNHFFEYYELARTGNDDERKWLTAAIIFNRNLKEHTLGNFLEVVLRYPDQFPKVTTEVNNYQWFETIAQKGQALYGASPDSFKHPAPASFPILLSHAERNMKKEESPQQEKIPFSTSNQDVALRNRFQDLFDATSPPQDQQSYDQILDLLQKFPSNENNTFKSQVKSLMDDIEALRKIPPPQVYQLKNPQNGLIEIKKRLEKPDYEVCLDQQISDILAMAWKEPSSDDKKLVHKLKTMSGIKRLLTFDELLVNFGKNDPQFLLKRNPALTKEDIAILYGKIGDFLIQATAEQQRQRCTELLKEVEKSPKGSLEEKENIQLLGEALFAKRVYNPEETPHYLVFEYCLNILIREQQKNKMGKIQPNTVSQMLMGEGKTTVLYQLLGEMRADGKNISLLVMPEPLVPSIALYSQKVHFTNFGKELRAMHFNRQSKFSIHSLEAILANLTGAQKSKECVIMTSKSIACLILKYIALVIFQNQEQGLELKLMSQILEKLASNGYPLIDEIDTILKVLHEVSFSLGSIVPVDECEYATIAELYNILFTDVNIKQLARCKSDPNPNPKAEVLTIDVYHQKVKKPLADTFIQRLPGMKFSSPAMEAKVQAFGVSVNNNAIDKDLLQHYLCQDKVHLKEAQRYYNNLDPDIQQIIALASQEIYRFLPYTLTMISEKNYGFNDKGDLFASPYSAADTPSKDSEFKNSHITMNTTFQLYLEQGISENILIKTIEQLKQRALKEVKDDPTLEIRQTKAFITFEKIKGDLEFPLLNYNDVQIKVLLQKINQDIASKTSFIINAVIPHIIRYESSITFNPQNFIDFFDRSSGFSGTLANAITMHHKLKVEAEAGTDAKTLKILFEESRFDVTELPSNSINDLIETIDLNFDVLIDGGGYCKGKNGSSTQIAELIAKRSNCKVVVYDKKGIKQEVSKDKVTLFKEDLDPKRKTVFDESRATGGDIKQKTSATAKLTIGESITLRDLWQHARRLRGLGKGQKVSFWVSPDVASMIRKVCNKEKNSPLNFDDIFYFAVDNQSKQFGLEYFKAFKQQLDNIAQIMLLKAVITLSLQGKEADTAKELLEKVWLKPGNKMPNEMYGELSSEVDEKEGIESESTKTLRFLEECFQKLPSLASLGFTLENSKKEIKRIQDRFAGLLPPKIKIQELDDNQTTEQEVEIEAEMETEAEMDVEQSAEIEGIQLKTVRIDKLIPIQSLDQPTLAGTILSLPLYLRSKAELSDYADAFEGISMTVNVLQFTMDNPSPDNLKLFGPHRTPLLNFARNDEGLITLISRNEAINARLFENYKMKLDNLTLCNPSQAKKKDRYGYQPLSQEAQTTLLLNIVKCKFLNGECNFNKKEAKVLKEWIKDSGPSKMMKFYQKHVLLGFPLKRAAYNADSDLLKIFRELQSAELGN